MQEMRKLIKTPLKHRPLLSCQLNIAECLINISNLKAVQIVTFSKVWQHDASLTLYHVSLNLLPWYFIQPVDTKICLYTCPLFYSNTIGGKVAPFRTFQPFVMSWPHWPWKPKNSGWITVSFRQGRSTRCPSWEQFRRKNRIHRPPFPPIIRSIIKTEFLEQEWKIGFEHYRRICIELVLKTFCKNENGVWTLPLHWPHERSDGIPFCKVVAIVSEAMGICTNNALCQRYNLYKFFPTSKFMIWKSFRTKNTIYVAVPRKPILDSTTQHRLALKHDFC